MNRNQMCKQLALIFCFFIYGLANPGLSAQEVSLYQEVLATKRNMAKELHKSGKKCTWDSRLYKTKEKNGLVGLYTYQDVEIIPPQFSTILGPPFNWLVQVATEDREGYEVYNLAGIKLPLDNIYSMRGIPDVLCALDA